MAELKLGWRRLQYVIFPPPHWAKQAATHTPGARNDNSRLLAKQGSPNVCANPRFSQCDSDTFETMLPRLSIVDPIISHGCPETTQYDVHNSSPPIVLMFSTRTKPNTFQHSPNVSRQLSNVFHIISQYSPTRAQTNTV